MSNGFIYRFDCGATAQAMFFIERMTTAAPRVTSNP
jgi:hypothetical protein